MERVSRLVLSLVAPGLIVREGAKLRGGHLYWRSRMLEGRGNAWPPAVVATSLVAPAR